MVDYPETHPVQRLRGYLEHPENDIAPSIRKEVERLINMWEALDAQTRRDLLTEQPTIVPCPRCLQVQKLFPAPEPEPIDAASVKRWIDEHCNE